MMQWIALTSGQFIISPGGRTNIKDYIPDTLSNVKSCRSLKQFCRILCQSYCHLAVSAVKVKGKALAVVQKKERAAVLGALMDRA